MRRSPGIAVRDAQQLAHWAVGGHQVGTWPHGGQFEAAVGLHLELAAQVVLGLAVVHLPVHAVVGVLPEVDGGVGQGLAIGVGHAPLDEHGLARVAFDQVAAVVHPGRAPGVEGPQHAAFGGTRPRGQQVDQGGQAQHIGHQGELAARGAADLCSTMQKGNAFAPFFVAQTGFAGESVQVVHQAVDQVALTVIVDVRKTAFDGIGQVVSGDIFHGAVLRPGSGSHEADGVAKNADAFDVNFDRVARLHPHRGLAGIAHTRRRAHDDHVTGLQRHAG